MWSSRSELVIGHTNTPACQKEPLCPLQRFLDSNMKVLVKCSVAHAPDGVSGGGWSWMMVLYTWSLCLPPPHTQPPPLLPSPLTLPVTSPSASIPQHIDIFLISGDFWFLSCDVVSGKSRGCGGTSGRRQACGVCRLSESVSTGRGREVFTRSLTVLCPSHPTSGFCSNVKIFRRINFFYLKIKNVYESFCRISMGPRPESA